MVGDRSWETKLVLSGLEIGPVRSQKPPYMHQWLHVLKRGAIKMGNLYQDHSLGQINRDPMNGQFHIDYSLSWQTARSRAPIPTGSADPASVMQCQDDLTAVL
jgi:hypothetical protein